MIGTQFTYEAPDNLKGVLDLIGREGYQVLTADQSLVSALKKGHSTIQSLVSLRKVPGLTTVRGDASMVQIGASASYASLSANEAIGHFPALAQALATIQEPHTRHHCTLGGALHYGSSVHDPVVAALMALDATAVIQSRLGDERMPVQAFSHYGQRVPFPAGKLLTGVIVSASRPTQSCYVAQEQLPGKRVARGVAVAVQRNDRGVEQARVVLAGFSEQPQRLPNIEAALAGKPLTPTAIADAAEKINETSLPLASHYTPEGYYRQIARVLIRRALTSIANA